jgi:hypothetical protein
MPLEGIPLGNLTAAGLLGIAVLLILLGRLKTKSDFDKVEEAAEKWRQAYETEREARAAADAQTAELLELAKTTHQVVIALFGATQRYQKSGGADVVSTSQD